MAGCVVTIGTQINMFALHFSFYHQYLDFHSSLYVSCYLQTIFALLKKKKRSQLPVVQVYGARLKANKDTGSAGKKKFWV